MTDATEKKPDVYTVIRETLGEYHLSNMVTKGTTDAFPLVDLLSNDGTTTETGHEEIAMISDALVDKLLANAPDSPVKRISEALGLGGGRDAALNLEGAIDTLLIANGMTEADTVIRTMRRVLGQIEEAVRVAELEQVRSIAD